MQMTRLIAFLLFIFATHATAQTGQEDYRVRQENLLRLSAIFGEVHHIRRMCVPQREADIWRNRMMKLIELEAPAATQNRAMTKAFNDGYYRARRQFNTCNRAASSYAASRADEGERVVAALMAPLYDSLAQEEGTLPFIQRGGDGPQQ